MGSAHPGRSGHRPFEAPCSADGGRGGWCTEHGLWQTPGRFRRGSIAVVIILVSCAVRLGDGERCDWLGLLGMLLGLVCAIVVIIVIPRTVCLRNSGLRG